MDGVALASVITSGAAVIATSGVAVWTTRQSANLTRESARESARLARETRVHQRLAESYLEVLRIVEREGQWIEATIKNWETAADEADWGVSPEDRGLGLWERVKVPEPAVTDRAVIAAQLAAFGSEHVRGFYIAWQSTIQKIEIQARGLKALARECYRPLPPDVKDMLGELRPQELDARQALAGAIAEELGHR